MIEKLAINRPLVVRRGWSGFVESNSINAYVGEWAVFVLPLSDTSNVEIRMPIEEALEQGLVIDEDKIVYAPEDYEEL